MYKLLGWLFKGYIKSLKEDNENALKLQMEAFKRTIDVKDLVRERLKGIRPNHPEENTILQNHLASLDDATRLVFLSKAHEILGNETSRKIIESIITESEHKAMMDAVDIMEVNFNRSTINGIMLYEDELNRLDTMYKEEVKLREIMTEEERLSAI